ncbi:MAG: chitinase [Psychroserpens sp.]|jgi:chitinase
MKKIRLLIPLIILTTTQFINGQTSDRVVLGYFPSWSENLPSADQNSKLREVPSFVNYIFLSFAKPNLSYTIGSYDISDTGIQTPYNGCTLRESVSVLKDKGIQVILSIGGETYWGSPEAYNINYQEIKDLVDDIGFAGIDWDFEPNGSFAEIGNSKNVQHFIDFFNNSRTIMPRSDGYILACAPSGVGALGGQVNDDSSSPFAFANRKTLTGENDANLYSGPATTNGINLFGFTATGHMIPVFQSIGDKIDLVAYQGYNAGGSTNRSIMYDAFAYYAEQYGFLVAAGVYYPNEPWGPYYEYNHTNVASLSQHIIEHPTRNDDNDGIMIWQLLRENSSLNSSAYSYMNVASSVFSGSTENNAILNANNYSLSPYTGGAKNCDDLLMNDNSKIKIYSIPSKIYPIPSKDFIQILGFNKTEEVKIYNTLGVEVLKESISNNRKINIQNLNNGMYFLNFENGNTLKFIKD